VGLGSGVLRAKNKLGHAREVGDHPSVTRLIFLGYLGGLAKSVCYIIWFWWWALGQGVLRADNRPVHTREVESHPSVVCLIFSGYLG